MLGGARARLARRLRRYSARGVVLCYHRVAGPQLDPAALDVPPDMFAAHMDVLRRVACPLALGEFERRRRDGQLPARAVAVTFDDGYADNLHAALPILEAQGIPATVFVTTGGIGAATEFWWDALERACYASAALPARLVLEVNGERVVRDLDEAARAPRPASGLDADDTRRPLYDWLSAWLRVRPPAVQREVMVALQQWAGVEAAARPTHRTLREDELVRLAQSPHIEIGAHSVTHPVLGLLDSAAQRDECVRGRESLNRWLGATPVMFAYPFGEGAAVTRAAEAAVRAAGFEAAFTTDARAAWRWNRRTAVPRFAMQAWSAAEFARRLEVWFLE